VRSPDRPITRFVAASILSLLLLTALTVSSFADSVHEIARRIDARYNHLTTLKAHFAESYNGAGITRNEAGELWLQKPGRMRWQYEQPTQKLFMVDGKNAYFYVPSERQARKMPAKKLDDFRSPIRYLLGKTKLESEFNNLAISNDAPKQPGDVVLQGIPKGMEDRVQRVLLEITPANQIRRIRLEQIDGSVTEFRFQDIQENVPVRAELFHFTPPPGVEVIEAQNVEP
jgi:outer membrane lipoprotein carrier protein